MTSTENDECSSHSDLYRRLETDEEPSIFQLNTADQEVTDSELAAVEVNVEPTTVDVIDLVTVVHVRHVVGLRLVIVPPGLIVHIRLARYHYA